MAQWVFPIFLASTVGIIAVWRYFVSAKQRRQWIQSQSMESAEEFVKNCDLQENAAAAQIALTMRESLATVAGVPVCSLMATAKVHGNLGKNLDLDYADWLDVKVRTEKRLRIKIPETAWLAYPRVADIPAEDLEFRNMIQAAAATASSTGEIKGVGSH